MRSFDDVKDIFDAMRCEPFVMSEYQDNESALLYELMTCTDDHLRQYRIDNGLINTYPKSEKHYESTEAANFGEDKAENYYISGDYNDYRVVKTTMGVYDEEYKESNIESIGWGAYVTIYEVRENREDILTYIEKALEDYEWNRDNISDNRGIMETLIKSDPNEASDLVENILTILEKVA